MILFYRISVYAKGIIGWLMPPPSCGLGEIRNFGIYNSWELLRSWMQKTKLMLTSCRIKKTQESSDMENSWAPGFIDTTHINSVPLHKNTRLWHSLSPWMSSLDQQLQQNSSICSQAGDQELSALARADTTPSIYIWHFNITDWTLLTVSTFRLFTEEETDSTFRQFSNDETQTWSLHPPLTPGSIWTFVSGQGHFYRADALWFQISAAQPGVRS